MPPGGGTGIDTRYGYTEQVAPVTVTGSNSGNVGNFGTAGAITKPILHTLGLPNEWAFLNPRSTTPTQQEQWDYFPFNDRDFTSVAELMLVPGCPPGLFTKQFAEFAPTDITPPDPNTSVTLYFKPAVTANLVTPYLPGPPTVVSGTATDYFTSDTYRRRRSAHVPLPGGQVLLHRGDRPLRAPIRSRSATRRRTAGSRCSSSSRCPAR